MEAGRPDDGFRGDYGPALLDHVLNPRNAGEVDPADASGRAERPECGDVVRLTFAIREGRIETVRFRCRGCPVALASASAATVMLAGRTVGEGLALRPEALESELGGVPEAKRPCLELAVRAIRSALG